MVNEEERYVTIRQAFIDHMRTIEGPYQIGISYLIKLDEEVCPSFPKEDILYRINPVFHRLVAEFCPVHLRISDTLPVIQAIKAVDSNTDYIYTIGHHFRTMHRYLYISNESIAMMLRLAL